jgi:hypothetical protein
MFHTARLREKSIKRLCGRKKKRRPAVKEMAFI